MLSFNQYIEHEYLNEARRNPISKITGKELNPKVSIFDVLEKYHNDENVYITYTADVGNLSHDKGKKLPKNAEGFKLGINPRSTFNTPNGLYTYPLKEAWTKYVNVGQKVLDVPFAGDNPWIWVVKPKNPKKIVILHKYNSKQWDIDYQKLSKMIIKFFMTKNKMSEYLGWEAAKAILNEANNDSRNRSPGGRFWNMTRYTYFCLTSQLATSFIQEYEEELIDGIKDKRRKANFSDEKIRLTIKRNFNSDRATNVWNFIMRELGYMGVADKMGEGIIHPSEPVQAVFFDTTKLDVLDSGYNKGYAFQGPGKASTYPISYVWPADKTEMMLILKNYLIYSGVAYNHMDAAQPMVRLLNILEKVKQRFELDALYIKGSKELANMAMASFNAIKDSSGTFESIDVFPTPKIKNGEQVIRFGLNAVEFKVMKGWENPGWGDTHFVSVQKLAKSGLTQLENWMKTIKKQPTPGETIKIDWGSAPVDYDEI